MIQKIRSEFVHYIPRELEEGVLYISTEYKTAAHLCACGCREKIRTPLTPTEWSVKETPTGPSLHPSIGNWQKKCQSHYWIRNGSILWASQWTAQEIEIGRLAEQSRRVKHYENKTTRETGLIESLWNFIKQIFRK